MVDIALGRVTLAERAELVREARLGVLDEFDRMVELHGTSTRGGAGSDAVVVGAGDGVPSEGATFSTRTAADLTIGCFETGSSPIRESRPPTGPARAGPAASLWPRLLRVSNVLGDDVSIIDAAKRQEVVRIKVGKMPKRWSWPAFANDPSRRADEAAGLLEVRS